MSKRKPTYPQDEFDQPAGAVTRIGVHRSHKSAWSRIWPFLLVFVLASGIGLGTIYALLQAPDSKVNELLNSVSSDSSESASPTTEPDDEGTEPTDGTETSQSPDASAEPSDEPSEEPSDEPSDEPSAEPSVNKSVSIRVLNAGGTQGAAGSAAKKLENDGFTQVQAANFEGEKPSSTVIYYKGSANRANAQAVGDVLGISNLSEVSSLRADISVVLR